MKLRKKVLVGLIGEGIAKSRTPSMHESEGAAQGLEYEYRLIDTAGREQVDLEALISKARSEGFTGLNITHPFKQKVLAHVSGRGEEVGRVGASNTIVFTDDGARAHNTDYLGFLRAFRDELDAAEKRSVLLVGAGGAGRAVGLALAETGVAHLFIADMNAGAAQALADDIARANPETRAEAIAPQDLAGRRFDGIVNATPMGMDAHPGMPVDRALLETRPWVADIVYFPLETEFLRTAREMGCLTMSGRGMAVMQAVKAFELFTGLPADPKRMGAVFDSFDR